MDSVLSVLSSSYWQFEGHKMRKVGTCHAAEPRLRTTEDDSCKGGVAGMQRTLILRKVSTVQHCIGLLPHCSTDVPPPTFPTGHADWGCLENLVLGCHHGCDKTLHASKAGLAIRVYINCRTEQCKATTQLHHPLCQHFHGYSIDNKRHNRHEANHQYWATLARHAAKS